MNPEEETPLKQIRTFQGDVADALHDEKHSLVSIQRKAEAQREASGESLPSASTGIGKKLLYLLGAIIFLGAGALAAWFGYGKYIEISTPPVAALPLNRFVPAAETVDIDISGLDRSAFLLALSTNLAEGTPEGEIKHVVLRNGVGEVAPLLTTQELFKLIDNEAPASLVRAFDPLFMYGVLGGESPSNFLIIKLVSFQNVYAGMLAWEPSLARDIASLMATETVLKSITLESVFQDITDQNKDYRVLYATVTRGEATSTEAVLGYSFLDNNTLILSDNLGTISTLAERLTREKLTR